MVSISVSSASDFDEPLDDHFIQKALCVSLYGLQCTRMCLKISCMGVQSPRLSWSVVRFPDPSSACVYSAFFAEDSETKL